MSRATSRGQQERELKFTPGPSFRAGEVIRRLPDLHAGTPSERTLHATYFDTADLRLARTGASLRWRDDEGWMVKLPSAGSGSSSAEGGDVLARDEILVEGAAPGHESGIPAEALDLVYAVARTAPVEVVAKLVTVRNRVDLFDADDRKVAEMVDDEVSVLDGSQLVTRFREIEVEFTKHAGPDLPREVAAAMKAGGAGKPDPVPKIVRALGQRAGDAPDLREPEPLDEAALPIDVLRAAVVRSTRRLVAHDPGVRHGDDMEEVHQARVATRRLRSDLRTFGAVVDHEWSDALRDELKWLGGLLGAVRDTDVLLERLERRLGTLDDIDEDAGHRLLAGLHAKRDAARDELLAAMRAPRYLELLDRLHRACRRIPGPRDASDLGVEVTDLVHKPWRKLRKAADKLRDDSPDPELHHVRILAKRCRYAAEAVAPAVGKDASRFAKRVTNLQDVLGEHQDAVIAGQWLREHADDTVRAEGAAGAAAVAFVAGELAMLEQAAADASRELWPEAWHQARAKRLRKWMRAS
jgi:CHAD domain-containing protein